MTLSRSFINFASVICILSALFCMTACKGRTIDNVEPTGDTVEVVILQDSIN